MKRIINKKCYDTATATEVAEFDNNCGPGDFKMLRKTLYLTKKGNWFMHGEGGAMTEYAESCGNNCRCGGSTILPLTPQEAYEFCERYHATEAITKYFGDLVEDA